MENFATEVVSLYLQFSVNNRPLACLELGTVSPMLLIHHLKLIEGWKTTRGLFDKLVFKT